MGMELSKIGDKFPHRSMNSTRVDCFCDQMSLVAITLNQYFNTMEVRSAAYLPVSRPSNSEEVSTRTIFNGYKWVMTFT